MMSESGNMAQPHHDDVFVRELFDKMGPTYGRVNQEYYPDAYGNMTTL